MVGFCHLTDSHHYHHGQKPTMVGICHGGNMPVGPGINAINHSYKIVDNSKIRQHAWQLFLPLILMRMLSLVKLSNTWLCSCLQDCWPQQFQIKPGSPYLLCPCRIGDDLGHFEHFPFASPRRCCRLYGSMSLSLHPPPPF